MKLWGFVSEMVTGATVALVSYLYGGWSLMLNALFILMFFDIISSYLKHFYLDNLRSKQNFKGLMIKKLGILIAIAIGHQIDLIALGNYDIFGLEHPAFMSLIVWFIGLEIISNVENLGTFLPFPEAFKKIFPQIREELEKREEK